MAAPKKRCVSRRIVGAIAFGEPQQLEFRRPSTLADFFVLSPYVVRSGRGYEMLLRMVNPSDDPAKKVSRIYYASSSDGIAFDVGPEVIAPGDRDDPDGAGCEDPTVVGQAGAYSVFYSGYNAVSRSSAMLRAAGKSLTGLTKAGFSILPRSHISQYEGSRCRQHAQRLSHVLRVCPGRRVAHRGRGCSADRRAMDVCQFAHRSACKRLRFVAFKPVVCNSMLGWNAYTLL